MSEISRFERVRQILDTAVNGEIIGAHGAFWRGRTRDEFVEMEVFGQQLVVVGNCEESNLISALKGTGQFDNSPFRRMPAGRKPVPDQDIEFICKWIDDGCPDKDTDQVDPEEHNAYWREFDNWAMFAVSPEVQAAIGSFMGSAAMLWMAYALDNSREQAWEDAIKASSMSTTLTLLSTRQTQTVREHFGRPIIWKNVLDSFEKFGSNTLPDDHLRPVDPRHNMNGATMWFFWSAFADACLRLDIDRDFWLNNTRAILLGLMSDGLFRGRFQVKGFTADDEGKKAVRSHVEQMDKDELRDELVRRYQDSGFRV